MLKRHLDIFVVCVLGLFWAMTPLWGVSFLRIKKSENPLEITSSVSFNRQLTQKLSSYYWSQNVEKFFPQGDGDPKIYEVIVDLTDLSSVAVLGNISRFLEKLGDSQESNVFAPRLIIDNGTSYRFNQIFPGVQHFFQKTPHAEVWYSHAGTQTPRAPQKGLGSLALVESVEMPAIAALDTYPCAMENLVREIENLRLSSECDQKSDLPVFLETDDEGHTYKALTRSPETFLKKKILYEEAGRRLRGMKDRWEKLGGGDWPPLNIRNLRQVADVNIEEIKRFSRTQHPDLIFLRVSGLQGREDVREITTLCRATPSIRCVLIKESICSFYSLHPFMGDREQEDDEILNDRPLLGDQIQFLEVSDAFNAVDTDELPGYFKENGFVSSIPYVVWRKPYSSNITSLELDSQTTHQLFWILSEYLTLLNFEFNESPDQSTS